jgi:hypothetical protein
MAGTKTEKQTKAQRLKDVYESMSDERFKALEEEIRNITSECNERSSSRGRNHTSRTSVASGTQDR